MPMLHEATKVGIMSFWKAVGHERAVQVLLGWCSYANEHGGWDNMPEDDRERWKYIKERSQLAHPGSFDEAYVMWVKKRMGI